MDQTVPFAAANRDRQLSALEFGTGKSVAAGSASSGAVRYSADNHEVMNDRQLRNCKQELTAYRTYAETSMTELCPYLFPFRGFSQTVKSFAQVLCEVFGVSARRRERLAGLAELLEELQEQVRLTFIKQLFLKNLLFSFISGP